MKKQPVKLLSQGRAKIRLKHYSIRAEQTYVNRVKRFILSHGKGYPKMLEKSHIEGFLSYLAVEGKVSASTQNQAFSALLFLYRDVLGKEFADFRTPIRAKKDRRFPVG